MAAYETLLKQAPTDAEALFGSGMVLAALGAVPQALTQLDKAHAASPERTDIAFARASLLFDADRLIASETAYEEAHRLGRSPRDLLTFAQGMRNLGRLERAEDALRRAITLEPTAAPLLALSDVLIDRYRVEEAVDACRRACLLAPSSAASLRLGTRLLEAGRTDPARRAFRQAIVQTPANTAARYSLARITRHAAEDADVREVRRLADASNLAPRRRADAHFALFKVYEDLDRTEAAFDHLARANALVRSQISYSSAADQRYFERIRTAFDSIEGADPRPIDGPGAGQIFVVGLPRSGTTLVEQILASHPMVHGAGEIQNLRLEMLRGFERGGATGGFPDGAPFLDRAGWQGVGDGYITSLEPSGRPVTVNKTPGNFQMVPAIWRALPGARIVHCRRNPLDTCFSIYRHNFVGWGLHYAYDQTDVAALYAIYDRFMAHWSAHWPDRLFDLSYERLVEDPETVARALLNYCGLPWDDRCLDFANTRRIVRTASVEQVRRPIHAQAVGSWKRYAAHLGPMRDGLRAAGIEAEA
ncbi:sulfotransferase [Thalassobaculum sp. OXR-137]|nr:sulfotransferase [Thalassobaculum sp. OXR-137]WPZ34285.1 sulfotransferase [Thalassobaculum sp. OXR-137]